MGLESGAKFTGTELAERLRSHDFSKQYGPTVDGLILHRADWVGSSGYWDMRGSSCFNGVRLEFVCEHIRSWAAQHVTLSQRRTDGTDDVRLCHECHFWQNSTDSEGNSYWRCHWLAQGTRRPRSWWAAQTPDGVRSWATTEDTPGCSEWQGRGLHGIINQIGQRWHRQDRSDPRVVVRDPDRRREWGVLDYKKDYILLGVRGWRLLVARDPNAGGGWHVLRVPPNMETVEEAHAWTFDISTDDYHKIKEQS